jgi:nitroimidazol reductase NimA-like FMN-containing flavoprotein (pyridoxamine 5'-phosphate oxidase superfamily)
MQKNDLPLQPRRQVLDQKAREDFLAWVQSFLRSQKVLILASCKESKPTCNLMSYGIAPGQCRIVIATPKDSRKCTALRQNQNASLLVLDQAALQQDLKHGIVLTLSGVAREVRNKERQDLEEVFVHRNPDLDAFVRDPDTVVFCIDVNHLVAVTNFQDLRELTLES